MRAMEAQELKSLGDAVEAGTYKPDPAQVAAAMLQRRGVRELLTGLPLTALPPNGRTPLPPEARPRAA